MLEYAAPQEPHQRPSSVPWNLSHPLNKSDEAPHPLNDLAALFVAHAALRVNPTFPHFSPKQELLGAFSM
jgi:hypothetical protein